MIVYVLSPRNVILQAAKKVGISIVPVGNAKQLQDLAATEHKLTVSDALDAVEICRALSTDGVSYGETQSVCLGLGDDSSQTAALVNATLALAGGRCASFVSLERMRNKLRLRKYLGATSTYNGRSWQVEKAADLATILNTCPNGAILKPMTGSGSRGVVRIADASALEGIAFEGPMLLEEYFSGPEYSVESISWDGIHHPLVVTEKSIGGRSGLVEIGQRQPARLTNREMHTLFMAASDILARVEYRFGFSHLEFILQDSIAKLVEAHGRVGGDRIADLMRWSLGRDGFELLLRAYKNDSIETVQSTGIAAATIFPDLSEWSHSDEHWLQSVQRIDGVVEAVILRDRNERHQIFASSDRHAQVIITGRSIENIAHKVNNLGA